MSRESLSTTIALDIHSDNFSSSASVEIADSSPPTESIHLTEKKIYIDKNTSIINDTDNCLIMFLKPEDEIKLANGIFYKNNSKKDMPLVLPPHTIDKLYPPLEPAITTPSSDNFSSTTPIITYSSPNIENFSSFKLSSSSFPLHPFESDYINPSSIIVKEAKKTKAVKIKDGDFYVKGGLTYIFDKDTNFKNILNISETHSLFSIKPGHKIKCSGGLSYQNEEDHYIYFVSPPYTKGLIRVGYQWDVDYSSDEMAHFQNTTHDTYFLFLLKPGCKILLPGNIWKQNDSVDDDIYFILPPNTANSWSLIGADFTEYDICE